MRYNFDPRELPDVSQEDLAQLTEMIPGLLREGSMIMLRRHNQDLHDTVLVTLREEHVDLDSRPAAFSEPWRIWVWDRQRLEWLDLDLSKVVAAESTTDPEDLDPAKD
jgi:hypothetical protein